MRGRGTALGVRGTRGPRMRGGATASAAPTDRHAVDYRSLVADTSSESDTEDVRTPRVSVEFVHVINTTH